MSKHLIYCFSGSGNSLSVAKIIARSLGNADIVLMRKPPVITDATEAETVGFVFPCHGGGLPGKTADYIRDIRVGENTYTYGVVTYAVSPGTGLQQISDLIPLRYRTGIVHYNACIWLADAGFSLPDTTAKEAEKLAVARSWEIARKVKARAEGEDGLTDVPLDAVTSSLWRSLQTRKSRQMTVEAEKCTGCGTCVTVCPQGNFEVFGGTAHLGRNCIGCLSCLQFCPTSAIGIGHLLQKRERYHNHHVRAEDLAESVISFSRKPTRRHTEGEAEGEEADS